MTMIDAVEHMPAISWSERELPQRVRTKHVHGLHPYFGKFVPQLVDYFLTNTLREARMICDPFCGSGTTLVEANRHRKPSLGIDISPFNALLCRVKTRKHDVLAIREEVGDIMERVMGAMHLDRFMDDRPLPTTSSAYLNKWFHPEALTPLLIFRDLIPEYRNQDVLKVILSRAARSSRMIEHHETDHPKEPQPNDYYCIKHNRTCHPTKNSMGFLRRYCTDTVNRLADFEREDVLTHVECADSTTFDFTDTGVSDVFTSPPYIGLIDYHEQHRYAYELLGLPTHESEEIGSRRNGASKRAISAYKQGISKTIKNVAESTFRANSTFAIVVYDKLGLYDDIVTDAGLHIYKRLRRDVNRRSGRRASSLYEDILLCRL